MQLSKYQTMAQDLKKTSVEVMHDYKIDPKTDIKLIDKNKFFKVSSCGPLERQRFFRKPADVIRKAVRTIERFWLGQKDRKFYLKLKRDGRIKSIIEHR